jgi:hypothetical protein
MKLKEFDLWAFKLELPQSRKFTLFNRSVCAHFERHFKCIDTNGVYGIIIKLCESDERDGTTEISSSVLKYYKPFDFTEFNNLGEMARKKYLLNTLFDALLELCEKFGWPKEPFEEAYNLVLCENFVNHYCFKKKNSKNRKMIAELECRHESTKFDCLLNVKDKEGNQIFSKLLFTEEPDEYLFNSLLGDIKWIDNETLAALKKDRSEIERFKIE